MAHRSIAVRRAMSFLGQQGGEGHCAKSIGAAQEHLSARKRCLIASAVHSAFSQFKKINSFTLKSVCATSFQGGKSSAVTLYNRACCSRNARHAVVSAGVGSRPNALRYI